MTDLQTRLSEASAGSRELDREIWEMFDPDDFAQAYRTMKAVCPEGSSDDYVRAQMFTYKRYTTSIDAALALIKEVLPDAGLTIENCKNAYDKTLNWRACISANYKTPWLQVEHKSPAIALILALLAATEARDD